VLSDVDASIRAWLAAELSAGTEIGFDSPALLTSIQRRPRRAAIVNLFLFGITENLDGMPVARVQVRNTDGRVTGTRAPMRSYHLSYLITAWAADTAEEHELLGAVIGAHAESDAIETDHLRGSLRQLDTAMPMRLGWSPTGGNLDMWGALGVPMRTALELTVTAPALPSRLKPAAPPVEAIELDVHDSVDRALVPEPPRRRWERTTLTEH
jgi:hypothetical protein